MSLLVAPVAAGTARLEQAKADFEAFRSEQKAKLKMDWDAIAAEKKQLSAHLQAARASQAAIQEQEQRLDHRSSELDARMSALKAQAAELEQGRRELEQHEDKVRARELGLASRLASAEEAEQGIATRAAELDCRAADIAKGAASADFCCIAVQCLANKAHCPASLAYILLRCSNLC